jgi:hypothetical protein
MAASSFKTSAEYQRERRELADYGAYTHPGAALVDWLKEVLPE